MIEIKELSYKEILNDISVVFDSSINYIQGDNGAGKSTLLDCICGINKKYTGEILGNESIIYMNQNLYFDARLKARDFVQFVLELNGKYYDKKEFMNHIEFLEEKADFLAMLNKPVGILSGGERVKLFFSTLTFIDRCWYVFDEPFSGVDSKGKEYMCRIIDKLVKKGKKIIITSHEEGPINDFDNVKKWKLK